VNCAGGSLHRLRGKSRSFFFQTLRFIILTAYYPNMPLTLDQIAEEAMRLPPASRALLAEKMVESLETEELDEIQRLWSAEAIRRRDETRSGQVKPIPGEQVIEEVRRLVGR
jgi:putative addiction module component (TIGR02574 family)